MGKIKFLFVSAHSASFMKMGAKLRGWGGRWSAYPYLGQGQYNFLENSDRTHIFQICKYKKWNDNLHCDLGRLTITYKYGRLNPWVIGNQDSLPSFWSAQCLPTPLSFTLGFTHLRIFFYCPINIYIVYVKYFRILHIYLKTLSIPKYWNTAGRRPPFINFYLKYYWWIYETVVFQITSKSHNIWRIWLLGG